MSAVPSISMNKPILARILPFNDSRRLKIRKIKYFHTIDSSTLLTQSKTSSSKTSKKSFPSKEFPRGIKYVANLSLSFDLPKRPNLHAHFAKTVRKLSTFEVRDWKLITPYSCFGLELSLFVQFKYLKQIDALTRTYIVDNSEFQSMTTSLDLLNQIPSSESLKPIKKDIRFWYELPKKFEINFHVTDTKGLYNQEPGFRMRARLSPIQTLDTFGNPIAWWQITGAQFFFPKWDYKIESSLNFVKNLPHLKSLQLQMHKTQSGSLHSSFGSFFSDIAQGASLMKRLSIICDGLTITSQDLRALQFPKSLTSLCLRIGQGLSPQNVDDLMELSHFGSKIKELTGLKSLELSFPTTIYVNQMVHNMPNTLTKLENLKLDFVEENEKNGFEEFYVNSCLEWTMSMPNLKNFSLRSNRLNYTYCSFLDKKDLPKEIQKIEWTDQCLSNVLKPGNENYSNEMWIECKKNEDINVVLGIVSPKETKCFEMPLVFDVLPAQTALEKLIELLTTMENLEKTVLAVGFKLLEFKDILTVEQTLQVIRTSLGQGRVPCIKMNVYFRELSNDVPVDLKIFENQRNNRWPGSEISYIYSPY